MEIAIGIIIGILISLSVFASEFFLSKKNTSILKGIEKRAELLIKKEKGAIITTFDDEDQAISDVINENRKNGKDTRIKELYGED